MKMQEVSKRYAKALFEASTQVNKSSEVFEQLKIIQQGFSADVETYNYFSNPMNNLDAKVKILTTLTDKVKFSSEVSQFLKILVQNGRLQNLGEIVKSFQVLLDESQGVVRGHVTSAQSLSEEAKRGLTETISSVVHKKVIFDYETKSEVLGGVIANINGLTFDDTLQRHLDRMNEDLMKL